MTNFPKLKNIGLRYPTPILKGTTKSQYFSKSPLGDLGVKKGHLSRTQLICAIIILISSYTAHSQIVINELSASNASQIEDADFNEYSDWIELYNLSATAQNLNGYYLTDNFNSPDKWQIVIDLIIEAGGFVIIWADGYDTGNHSSFKLSADGEELALYSPNLALLDSISFGAQRANVTYGRKTDGAATWGYFQQATPNASNITPAYDGFADNVPEFSIRGGFYSSPFSVELFTDLGGEIRYTADGSEPLINSTKYTNPISISKTTILRTRIFKPNLIPGPTVTQTYFMNENSVDAKLPVVSITTEPANFWHPEKGIYVQDFKPLWEVPINIELFENNGSDRAAFNERAGCKVNGLYSWQLPQKMLGIYFDKQYGTSNLDYPVTPQRKRSSYKSFALRASGSDWSYTMFRDILGHHSTLMNMNIDIMGYKPSIVYVNGEYMGIHNIREKVDDDYIEKSYNLESGSFDLVENEDFAEAGDLDGYNALLQLLNMDLSVEANYNAVANVLDIENFTDYVITEMAVANTSINHNVMAWKPKDGGKWRWILMDVDRGFFNPTDHLIDFYENQSVWPFKNLLQNAGYKSYFGKRLAAQLFTSFNASVMNSLIDEHYKLIENEIPNHIERWLGTTSSYGDAMPSIEYWWGQVNDIRSFVEDRPAALLNDLQNYGFNGTVNLSLSTSPENAGLIKLDNLQIPTSNTSGLYIKNFDIQLVAENKPGYEFVGWATQTTKSIIAKQWEWKYQDSGSDLGNAWITADYNDTSWETGKGQLGYGDGDENTLVEFGNSSQNKYVTTYFRTTFTLTEEEKNATQFVLSLLRDDGAVVYLNGTEIVRSNINEGLVNYQTLAASSVSGSAESLFLSYPIDKTLFVLGTNILAVEVHQNDQNSSDLSFDLELQCTLPDNTILSDNNNINLTLTEDLALTALYSPTADCIIPEVLSENLILNKACSPYLAQGDIIITENATLTIEPGVEIWMPKGASIIVNGIINALGTEQERINFKLNPAYENSTWGIISLKNTPQASNLNYVTIEDASMGLDPALETAAISAFNADLLMENLTIENVEGNPIVARYSDITLTNSRLRSKITGDLINVKYGKARIENCTFEGNNQPDNDAIDYDEIENGIIKNCRISNFTGFNSDAIDIGEKASTILIDSIFVYNITDKGVSLGQRSSATIQNGVFVNCNMGVALKDSSHATINRCVFYSTVNAIACYEKNLGSAGGNANVTNSILSNISNESFAVDSKSTLITNYCLTDIQTQQKNTTNLVGNPLFENPTFFDFRLKEGSPAIMAGYENSISIDLGTKPLRSNFQPGIMISQIFVNPDDLNLPEFITLYNPSSERVNLTGYVVTKGITAALPEGTYLDAEDLLYLTDNATSNSWWQQTKQVIQWESGHLSNNGESIQLEENHGIVIDFLDYINNGLWPSAGFSGKELLQLISPNLDNHFPESWISSSIDLILDTTDSAQSGLLSIYPNPTTGIITVKGLDYENQAIEIYNVSGQLAGKSLLNDVGFQTFSISNLPAGMYFIKVGENVQKLVKVN